MSWRHDVSPVEMHERPEYGLLARCRELLHRKSLGAGGIERDQRLSGYAVAYQLDGPKDSERSHLTNWWVLEGEFLQARPDRVIFK